MKLTDYLNAEKIKAVNFAAALGVPPSSLSRWMTGKREPRLRICIDIKRLTGGAVEPEDLLSPDTNDPNAV